MSKTIIERMCSIAEKMRPEDEDSGMPITNMKKASADIKALAKTLELTDVQAVILTAIVQKSARYSVSGNDLADELGLEYLKFLTYNKETEGLRKRGYIRIDKDGDIVMPREVIRELKENRPVKPERLSCLDTAAILMRIRKILDVRDDDDCTSDEAVVYLDTLMEMNLDKAFERRFLYKIRFDKPSLEARVSIWRSMIPELSEEEATQLAQDFDFSGGQIENIARKREVSAIIGLVEPSYAQVREFCTEEIIEDKSSRRKIGFNAA